MKPNSVTSAAILALSSVWLPIFSPPGLSFPLPWMFPMANRQAEALCIDAAESQGWRVVDVGDHNQFAGGAEMVLQVRNDRFDSQNTAYTLGCNYAAPTGQVQLYHLADRRNRQEDWFDPHHNPRSDRDNHWDNDWDDDWDDDWDGDHENWEEDWGGRRDDRWNDRWNNHRGDRWNDYENDYRSDSDWDNWRYDGGRVSSRRDAEGIARQAIESELGVNAGSRRIQIDQSRQDNQRWYVEGDVNGTPFVVRIRSEDGTVERFILR